MTASEARARTDAVAAHPTATFHRPETSNTNGRRRVNCGLITESPNTTPARYGRLDSVSLHAAAVIRTMTSAGWTRLSEYSTGYQARAASSHSARSRHSPGAAIHHAATSEATEIVSQAATAPA